MRILILTKNFDLGGTEKHVRELANALAERGNKVILVSRAGRQKGHLHNDVIHFHWKLNDLNYPLLVWKLTRLIQAYKIQIVHGHQRLGISLGTAAAYFTKIPSLATVHGQTKYDLKSSIIRTHLDRVIMVAENRLEGIKSDQLRAKSVVLHNGITMDPNLTRISPHDFTVCYISRHDNAHFKALKMLITEVWPKLSHAKLMIVGDGPFLGKVKELIALHDPSGNIETVGFRHEVTEIIQLCSLVLGVGRVAIEALSQKVPVLSLNGHFCGDLISSRNYSRMKELNFVARDDNPPDATDILNKISSFREKQSLIEAHTAELFPQVYEDFSLSSSITKITELYQETIARNQPLDEPPTLETSSSS